MSKEWRASSSVSSTSCSFSPGRMPTIRRSTPGASASATSTIRMLGIFGTKVSPPRTSGSELSTNSTASCSVIQKRVMRSSVMVTRPVCACCLKIGMTLPRLPTTLP
jgi:hypothetical protein